MGNFQVKSVSKNSLESFDFAGNTTNFTGRSCVIFFSLIENIPVGESISSTEMQALLFIAWIDLDRNSLP